MKVFTPSDDVKYAMVVAACSNPAAVNTATCYDMIRNLSKAQQYEFNKRYRISAIDCGVDACPEGYYCGPQNTCFPNNTIPSGGSCPTNESCISNKCTLGKCDPVVCGGNDRLCQSNELCGINGVCIPLPAKGSVKIGDRCPVVAGNDYCESGFCSGGTCTDPPGVSKCNPACITGQYCDVKTNTCKTLCNDNNCVPPKKCNNSTCVDCIEDGDCSNGKKCAGNGTCVECLTDKHCGSGQLCSGGSCIDSGTVKDCTITTDCTVGVCTDGKCIVPNNTCNFDTNCKEDETCKAGVCTKTACSPDCTEGQKCVRGHCEDESIFKQYWWAFVIGGATLFLFIIILLVVMSRSSVERYPQYSVY
jgi:Cys-rich repeat protein